MKTIFGHTIFVCLLLIFSFEYAIADESTKSPAKAGGQGVAVGAGIAYKDKPYKKYDSSDKTSAVPIVLYEGDHFFVRGQSLGWDFLDDDTWELAIVGEYLADGYDSSDSDFLRGMSDRDPSVGVGGHVIYRPENLGFKFVAVTDVADESEGSQMRGEVFYVYRPGNGFTVVPTVGIVWQDEDYNDWYYGVRTREATAARPAYSADDDINYRFDLALGYQKPGTRWVYSGGIRYELLGDEIDDSPITNDDAVFSAFVGVAYRFGN